MSGFADAPVWLDAAIMVVGFPLAVEVGYRLHKAFLREPGEAPTDSSVAQMVSAALALMGLLIGFTFAMAADRYETRRELVVSEANAIGTTRLRYELFDAPERGRLLVLLKDYMVARQAFAGAGTDADKLDQVDHQTEVIQAAIWRETGSALHNPASASLTTSVLQATNAMFDQAASRRAALDARVPNGVFAMLALFAGLTAAIVGYGLAAGHKRHLVVSSGLFVMVALAITLIIDLDQPRGGLITISQAPLDRLAATMKDDR
jgi:hypothetical protein